MCLTVHTYWNGSPNRSSPTTAIPIIKSTHLNTSCTTKFYRNRLGIDIQAKLQLSLWYFDSFLRKHIIVRNNRICLFSLRYKAQYSLPSVWVRREKQCSGSKEKQTPQVLSHLYAYSWLLSQKYLCIFWCFRAIIFFSARSVIQRCWNTYLK